MSRSVLAMEYVAAVGTFILAVLGAVIAIDSFRGRKRICWLTTIVVVGLVSLVAAILAIHWGRQEKTELELNQNESILEPGNLPTPRNPCGQLAMAESSLLVFLGPTATFYNDFPHTIISMGNDDILALDRDEATGNVVVSVLRIYDETGTLAARIYLSKNVNRVHYTPPARMERPDTSTFVVYDSHDHQVLNLKFLNRQALSIQGIFRHPGTPSILMTPDHLVLGGVEPGNGCIHGGNMSINNGAIRVNP